MPLLLDSTFVNQDGAEVKGDALNGKVIAVYFSAHWCPPCRGFTPRLKEFYEEAKKAGAPLEIIFVSSDKDEGQMKSYFAEHGAYLAVPFSSPLVKQLKENCEVRGIPTLAIVDSEGRMLHADGRTDVSSGVAAANVVKKWQELNKQ